ncbi:MAG: PQ-loop domain-containing transporter [Candidatus Aenigmatarchaeota archaeon]|nr:hypothetical protein [Nanoarchaeota archaeon]
MTDGMHHAHKRKRIYQKKEPYPHPNKWKRLLDKLIYMIGMIAPIMTIPQVLQIWVEQNASGISILTWSAWTVVAVFWIIYGLAHKEKPIVIIFITWIIIYALVISGALLYG